MGDDVNNTITVLKSEVFDMIREQETLNNRIQGIEAVKRHTTQKIIELENKILENKI